MAVLGKGKVTLHHKFSVMTCIGTVESDNCILNFILLNGSLMKRSPELSV